MIFKRFETYQILSIISLFFFILTLIFSSVSIKDDQIWLEQNLYNYTIINNEIYNNQFNNTELKVKYTLKYLSIESNNPIFKASVDKNNKYTNHEHICYYQDKTNRYEDQECGPQNTDTEKTVKTVLYLNIIFIIFLICLLVVEVNYLVIDLVSVSRNPKLIYYFLIFRFIYLIGTILILSSTILFSIKFPNSISFNNNLNDNNDLFHQNNFKVSNGLLLSITNCVFTSIGSSLIILSLVFYIKKLKNGLSNENYKLLLD